MLKFENNYLMKNITTLEIGGPAKKFIEIRTEEELIEAIKYAKENSLPYLVIGSGSNLLVSDSGFEGLIIKNSIHGIEQEGNILKVKTGTILQDLVDFTIEKGLAGLNKMTGIPGTVGGAVFGNAGAYGQGISDHILSVVILSGQAKDLQVLSKDQCGFGYRDSGFKKTKYTILEVSFELSSAERESLEKESKEVLEKRLVKYPPGIKCPGSFFKNIVVDTLPKEVLEKIPESKIMYGKIPAGSLLEEVGAKGDKLGNIEIAPYHANLFVNKGEGKASDFFALASKYVKLVKEKFEIILEPEVQLINLPPLVY